MKFILWKLQPYVGVTLKITFLAYKKQLNIKVTQ